MKLWNKGQLIRKSNYHHASSMREKYLCGKIDIILASRFVYREIKVATHLLLLQSIDATPSDSLVFTFYIQIAQFICLLSLTVCTGTNTLLIGVDIFIVEG